MDRLETSFLKYTLGIFDAEMCFFFMQQQINQMFKSGCYYLILFQSYLYLAISPIEGSSIEVGIGTHITILLASFYPFPGPLAMTCLLYLVSSIEPLWEIGSSSPSSNNEVSSASKMHDRTPPESSHCEGMMFWCNTLESLHGILHRIMIHKGEYDPQKHGRACTSYREVVNSCLYLTFFSWEWLPRCVASRMNFHGCFRPTQCLWANTRVPHRYGSM